MDPTSFGQPIVAVNAVVIRGDGVLLTRRSDNGLWCLPGGLVEFGETVVEALVRELREEVNVSPNDITLSGVYSANNIEPLRGMSSGRNSIILSFRCTIGAQVPELSDEVVEARFFPLTELPTDIVPRHARRALDAQRTEPTPILA